MSRPPSPAPPSPLTPTSFFTYGIITANGKLQKPAKATQQREEIHTKGSLALTRQRVKQFDFLLFLKSWGMLTSLRATDVGLAPCLITRTLSMMEPIFK